MTLLEIQLTVQQISQLLGKPLGMSLEQFNNYLRMAQDDLFKEFAHGYLSGNGAEVDSRITAATYPFIHEDSLSVSPSSFYGIPCSTCTFSSSIYVILAAYVYNSAQDFPNKMIQIDIVSSNELAPRFQNAITYPTTQYPIGIIDQSTSRLFIFPNDDIQNMHIRSLYRPTTPALVEAITDGVRTQDGSSTALQLDSMFHVDVVRKILQYLGVSIGNEFISTVVEQQKNLEQ